MSTQTYFDLLSIVDTALEIMARRDAGGYEEHAYNLHHDEYVINNALTRLERMRDAIEREIDEQRRENECRSIGEWAAS